MNELPPPLVPAHVNWGRMPRASLERADIRKSGRLMSDRGFKAYILLLEASYGDASDVDGGGPAGSLPNNERELACLAGFGLGAVELRRWRQVAEEVLPKFALCSDGRLYARHLAPFVVAEAAKMAELSERNREKALIKNEMERQRILRIHEQIQGCDGAAALPGHSHDSASAMQTCNLEDEARKVGKGSEEGLPSGSPKNTPSAASEAPAPAEPNFRAELFRRGLDVLMGMTGLSEPSARTRIGKWLKDAGDEAVVVLDAIERAAESKPAEPGAWITAAITKGRLGRTPPEYVFPFSKEEEDRRTDAFQRPDGPRQRFSDMVGQIIREQPSGFPITEEQARDLAKRRDPDAYEAWRTAVREFQELREAQSERRKSRDAQMRRKNPNYVPMAPNGG